MTWPVKEILGIANHISRYKKSSQWALLAPLCFEKRKIGPALRENISRSSCVSPVCIIIGTPGRIRSDPTSGVSERWVRFSARKVPVALGGFRNPKQIFSFPIRSNSGRGRGPDSFTNSAVALGRGWLVEWPGNTQYLSCLFEVVLSQEEVDDLLKLLLHLVNLHSSTKYFLLTFNGAKNKTNKQSHPTGPINLLVTC